MKIRKKYNQDRARYNHVVSPLSFMTTECYQARKTSLEIWSPLLSSSSSLLRSLGLFSSNFSSFSLLFLCNCVSLSLLFIFPYCSVLFFPFPRLLLLGKFIYFSSSCFRAFSFKCSLFLFPYSLSSYFPP